MILLDAYPLVALLADEPAAVPVGELIAEGAAAVPAPNLAEAVDVLSRLHGIATDRVRAAIESLQESTDLKVRGVDQRSAWRASELRIAHYHRMGCPISIADCLLLAAADHDDRVATSDPHVLAVASAEGIGWIDLPDSAGERNPPA